MPAIMGAWLGCRIAQMVKLAPMAPAASVSGCGGRLAQRVRVIIFGHQEQQVCRVRCYWPSLSIR
jgi:hypothetical protein